MMRISLAIDRQMMPQPTGYGFQPASSFGQQLQSQPQQYAFQSGYQNQQYPGYQGHPQQTGGAGYLSEFDPYAQQPQSQSSSQSSSQQTTRAPSNGPGNETHPRDFIRMHKAGLEAWDSYSWKQLFLSCDALKDAWSARKQQAEGVVHQMGGAQGTPDPRFGYNGQLEGWKHVSICTLFKWFFATLNHGWQVLKEANNNFGELHMHSLSLSYLISLPRHCRSIDLPVT
jgi:hypothetical protein